MLVDHGFAILGWWRVPTAELRNQGHLDRYVAWMRDERGFSSSTIVQWRSKIRDFLQWFERIDRPFSALDPSDLDVYFVTEGARRWSRVSTSGIAAALRVFLRYMASCGECDPRVGRRTPGTASLCTGIIAIRSSVGGRPPTSGPCRRGFAGGRP